MQIMNPGIVEAYKGYSIATSLASVSMQSLRNIGLTLIGKCKRDAKSKDGHNLESSQ